jgi:4-nitrophenyl phosphatase
MNKMQGFLIDLDGTIYKGKQKIDGADEFVRSIARRGFPYVFVTNNSSRTPEAVADHLRQLGIDALSDHVYTAAQAAARYIVDRQEGRKTAYIGESGLHQALSEAGLQLTNYQGEGKIELNSDNPDYVVQGIDTHLSYDKLKLAVHHIRHGAKYILTNPDLLLPSDEGLIPGAGSISASIQAASQTTPVVIGKPSPIIMKYAMEKIGLAPGDVWVIGDNLATDIAAGIAAGCKSALVLTGLTTKSNMHELMDKSGIKPDLVCEDLMSFLREITGE